MQVNSRIVDEKHVAVGFDALTLVRYARAVDSDQGVLARLKPASSPLLWKLALRAWKRKKKQQRMSTYLVILGSARDESSSVNCAIHRDAMNSAYFFSNKQISVFNSRLCVISMTFSIS